jgi:hypothetical protein
MATKSALISAVNGFITSVVNITKHRNSMLEVINELYPLKVSDNSTDETYTTQTNQNITYTIQIVKQGRSIRINGSFTYVGAQALNPNTTIFQFKDSEFKGDTSTYLGTNIKYEPYALKTTNNITTGAYQFSITISSNN